jgi:4-diphosphocytidyl-2-C-methyl-D-erythritol kinase
VSIALRSFAKINLGLKIGPARADGFHSLLTIYQSIALHDIVRIAVEPGEGIEIRCSDPRVPCDRTNTCWKVAERVLRLVEESFAHGLKSAQVSKRDGPIGTPKGVPIENKSVAAGTAKAGSRQSKIIIEIEKHLPVEGGMGAASSNAVAAMLGLERALGIELAQPEKMRIAAEVGSDLPLFLIGGTVLGVDRGQEVYALEDLPETSLVVVTPPVGVSTPWAFTKWDELLASESADDNALTTKERAVTMRKRDQAANAWLGERLLSQGFIAKGPASGVPAAGGDRAEIPLLDLVRTGIENDFERVVFPEYPELREVKSVLQREGARYASLSGSGSTLYGMFESAAEAEAAAERMRAAGHAAAATRTLGRTEFWKPLAASN